MSNRKQLGQGYSLFAFMHADGGWTGEIFLLDKFVAVTPGGYHKSETECEQASLRWVANQLISKAVKAGCLR